MSSVNEPSAIAFIDNIALPTPENTMTSEQKYWYNKGHEDGRKLTTVKELTDEEIADEWTKFIANGGSVLDVLGWTNAILRKAQEK